jgi:hypothetical protein
MQRLVSVFAIVITLTPATFAQDGVDAKMLERLVAEIELAPSLYAKHHEPGKLDLPKIAAKKLAEYALNEPSAAKERERFEAGKERYAKEHSLRAAVFEAVDVMESAAKLPIRMKLNGPIDPKRKAAFLLEQEPIALAIYKLERALDTMKTADAQRGNEKSKRWQANFDFTRARLESNLLFLYEYNYTLGIIRRDNLPELRPGESGWVIRYHPAIHVLEGNVQRYQRDMKSRLTQIQKDHADTPWAGLAEREGRRSFGMLWTPTE